MTGETLMKSLFEQNGGTYRAVGDYLVPNLTLPTEIEYTLGIWGQMRLRYLKEHKRILFVTLLTSGKLSEHLREIEISALKRFEIIIQKMSESQGITEQLKVNDMISWVGKTNNIHACAREIILNELIYD
jgi:hypothetical protein